MMSQNPVPPASFNLTELFRRVFRGGLVVVILSCVCAAIVWGVCLMLPQNYKATVLIEVEPALVYANYTETMVGVRRYDIDAQTVLLLAENKDLLDLARASLGKDQFDPQQWAALREKAVATMLDARQVHLKAVAHDAPTAVALVNAWAEALIHKAQKTNDAGETIGAWMARQTDEARVRWTALREQAAQAEPGSFDHERFTADAEVARNVYVSLSQSAEQLKITETISNDAIKVLRAADLETAAPTIKPLKYVLAVFVMVFGGGCMVLLASELARLDRG